MEITALLIGTNYENDPFNRLRGCENDVRNISYLIDAPGSMTVLLGPSANKANILEKMNLLVTNSKPGDKLFFHYSGHGTQVPDLNNDEKSGFDQAIVPYDFQDSGVIIDDDIKKIFQKVPAGVTLIALFDCCHSGSIADLPLNRDITEKQNHNVAIYTVVANEQQNTPAALKLEPNATLFGYQNYLEKSAPKPSGTIIVFSGCRDDQTSADAFIDGEFCGATSKAFAHAVNEEYKGDFPGFVDKIENSISERLHVRDTMRGYLKNHHFSQEAQESCAPALKPA